MPQANDWLFDTLWDLSDRAHEADLPAVAQKLEEAMDTLLVERHPDSQKSVEFRSKRYADANRRILGMARTKARTMKALNVLMSQARSRPDTPAQNRAGVQAEQAARPKPEFAPGQQVGASFSWPV